MVECWSVGVDVEPYYNDNELTLRRRADAIPSKVWDAEHFEPGTSEKIWKDKHGYKPLSYSLYGLVVNEVFGYDDAKRYKIPGNDTSDENIYYHVNDQGTVDTYIVCSNIKHHAAPCDQEFILPTAKNTMITVIYRIGFLSQWREIQDSVSKVILGFAVSPKNSDNKIANKPLTQSGD